MTAAAAAATAGTAKNSVPVFFFLQFPSCLFSAKFYDARSTYNMRGLFYVNRHQTLRNILLNVCL